MSSSPTWQFFVGQGSASVDTSWGSIPDFDGDGFVDVVVGAMNANVTGRVYEYRGGPAGVSPTPGVVLDVPDSSVSNFGSTVSSGDVDGDGYADLVVSAPCPAGRSSTGGCIGFAAGGLVFVYRGGPSGIGSSPSWTLGSPSDGLRFAVSTASAGDVNGDGYADVMVAAGCAGESNAHCSAGPVYLYYGGPQGLDEARTDDIPSVASEPLVGQLVAAGDLDGDGFGDVAIATQCLDSTPCGPHTYVYRGSADGLVGPIAALQPKVDSGKPSMPASAGGCDLDGDGRADIVVAAQCDILDPASCDGIHLLVFRGTDSGVAEVPEDVLMPRDAASVALPARAGDVDGDGHCDIAVGAPLRGNGLGRVYLYQGFPPVLAASYNDPLGEAGGFGFGVAAAGDLDGDGFADVLVGAPLAGQNAGRAHVYYGSASGLARPLTLKNPDGGSFGYATE